jgi:hypothetical protein
MSGPLMDIVKEFFIPVTPVRDEEDEAPQQAGPQGGQNEPKCAGI